MFGYLSSVRCVCVALISLCVPRVEEVQQVHRHPLEQYIGDVTGRESVVNCGEYAASTPPSKESLLKSLACADDSVKQHKPSRIVVHMLGEDSSLAHGMLSDDMGRAFYFDYDSAPCGGPGCAERFDLKKRQVSDVEVLLYAPGYYRLGLKSR